MSIIVDSVESFAMWSRPHVSKKIVKFHPTLTDLDAAPTVVWPITELLIRAAPLHILPRLVFGSSVSNIAKFGRCASMLCEYVSMKAAATIRVAASKVANLYHLLVATLAEAEPMIMAVAHFCDRNGRKATENLTGNVDRFSHLEL